jgi:hypothetical protein
VGCTYIFTERLKNGRFENAARELVRKPLAGDAPQAGQAHRDADQSVRDADHVVRELVVQLEARDEDVEAAAPQDIGAREEVLVVDPLADVEVVQRHLHQHDRRPPPHLRLLRSPSLTAMS